MPRAARESDATRASSSSGYGWTPGGRRVGVDKAGDDDAARNVLDLILGRGRGRALRRAGIGDALAVEDEHRVVDALIWGEQCRPFEADHWVPSRQVSR